MYATEPSLPPAGLSNDMMIYYAPSILYTENVSVMEMICASVCITSMISFTLEKKFRGSRSLDQKHNENKHRMAARGNATSFPLLGRFVKAIAKWRRNGKARSAGVSAT